MAMTMFFDPFHVEDIEEENGDEEEEEESAVDMYMNEDKDNVEILDLNLNLNLKMFNKDKDEYEFDHKNEKSNKEEEEDNFKLYLLKNEIDPFAPWPSILSLHQLSPEFLAIPADKRRQDLFAQVCPLLIQQHRDKTKKMTDQAKEWWTGIKRENWEINATWFQVIKKIKGNAKFALLNEKECEKEYKSKQRR